MGPEGERSMTEEERRWLSQLRWIRRARDYSMLWVKHTFRARFGVWVEVAGTDLMQYPDADVIAFSLAKLSAYWRAELGSDDEDVADRSAAFMASLEAWRDDYERPAKRPEATPAAPAAPGAKVHLRVTARSSACSTRAEVPVRYVATDDPSEVSCLQCRRTELWREALKDPSKVARYRPHCEAYEVRLRADRARFFAERAAAPAPVALPAPRVVPACHVHEGSETRH